MSLLKKRVPSKRQVIVVFAVCVTLIHSWSILNFLNKLPGWLLYLRSWTIAGIFAYSQLFALFESALLLLLLLAFAAVLPPRFLHDRFATQGSALLIILAVGAIGLHLLAIVPLWPSKKLFLSMGLVATGSTSAYLLLSRKQALEARLQGLVERFVIFLYIYLPLALLSALIILLRNLSETF